VLAEARTSVHVDCKRCQTVVFKVRLKVLRSLADLQLYESEFQTEGALTLTNFPDNAVYTVQNTRYQSSHVK